MLIIKFALIHGGVCPHSCELLGVAPKLRLALEYGIIKKSTIFPKQAFIQVILPNHGWVILTKFHIDRG